ncbi:hypothetical protein D3C81_1536520 [compost metagenome]
MTEPVQLDLFTYATMPDSGEWMDQCAGCKYNRPLNAWDNNVMACWYTRDNPGVELYGGDRCSGYDDGLQRDIVGNRLNGMYFERSTGKFVSFVLGRRYFEVTPERCLGDKAWKEKTMRERAI